MIVGKVREIWRYPVKSMAGEQLQSCRVEALGVGIPGDRGWALRDDQAGEIRGAKNLPALLQYKASYREQPRAGATAQVDIRLPDGNQIGSDDTDVNAQLSALLGRAVSLWPLQPASNKAHYRRGDTGAALVGMLSRNRLLRPLLEKILPYTRFESMTRQLLGREPGEQSLNYADLPTELFEFTSPPGTYFDLAPLHLLTSATLAAMQRVNPSAAWDARRFRPNFVIETAPGIEGLIEAGWSGRSLRIGTLALTCGIPTLRCGMVAQPQGDLPKDSTVLRSIVRDAAQNLGIYASASEAGQVAVGDVVELL